MSFQTIYRPLFEVQWLHNYFLNDGVLEFSSMSDMQKKRRLKLYDMSDFVDIELSKMTREKMAGHNMVFKKHKSGFFVYVEMSANSQNAPLVVLPNDLSLKFIVKIKDAVFGNYTALNLSGTSVFFFGNTKPSTEGANFKYVPRGIDNILITDDFKISSNGYKELLEDVSTQHKIGVFAIVQIKMHGDNAALGVTTTQGKLKVHCPVFKIHFNNRQTFWRYKKILDDTEIFTTPTVNPLTKYGFIEIEHNGDKYPNPSANHLIPDNNNFFSETYI